ncbi:Sua5/YciO/YrdC/YwlC family protein [uncultured Xylophilus sp.]|uniref:Sua5/YciO/YrdC/YwlC family protein n=1 Tax=uncultured Xylophilus sp. TaxID=296832 RepID=UPI0025EF3D48|nr:Sua5/YciO/YrdC/YwlC family protein [uncultured Xylophilus sp.]
MQLIDRGREPTPEELATDARRIFGILRSGGVGIIPFDVSYAIFAHTARAVERIYEIKNRSSAKPNGVIGNWDIFQELIDASQADRDLVSCVIRDHDLPLSVVGPYRADHDFLRTTEFGALRRSTKGPTMDLLLNAGALHGALARMSLDAATPLMGSSANRSLTGNKFALRDIEDEVLAQSDIGVDYGRCRYANEHLVGSTILEMGTRRVLRFGCCYEQIQQILKKEFALDLPDRPTSGPMSLV